MMNLIRYLLKKLGVTDTAKKCLLACSELYRKVKERYPVGKEYIKSRYEVLKNVTKYYYSLWNDTERLYWLALQERNPRLRAYVIWWNSPKVLMSRLIIMYITMYISMTIAIVLYIALIIGMYWPNTHNIMYISIAIVIVLYIALAIYMYWPINHNK